MKDVEVFHKNFYSSQNKIEQDSFLLKHVTVHAPKRRRGSGKGNDKSISIKYFVKIHKADKFQVQVCKSTFLNILHVSKDRVQRIARNHLQTGQMPREKRGGARIQRRHVEQRINIRRFVESLKCTDTHYCRGKSLARQYLPGDMSISKLHRMYNAKATSSSLQVKKTFFRNIITREYNLGFGTPVTDACSTCISLQEAVKRETDVNKKNELMIEMRVHKLKAKAFFNILKEEPPGVVQFSFDCQRNLVTPKLPDQIAYYSRQLYTYNCTVVQGSSKSKLTNDRVTLFTWMEHEYKKSSNEISSAVWHCLTEVDLTHCSTVRLCADGCGGQNRNSAMITMACYFLFQVAPGNVKRIELVFPVRGHSFLPSDRVFGNIEKVLRKIPVICDPTQYHDVFQKFGKVVRLGEDCVVKNWKEYAHQVLKLPASWHFKFASAKRFIIDKTSSGVIVSGEPHYYSDVGEGKSLMKRGKRFRDCAPELVPRGVMLNPAKVKDVKKLLVSHFGETWSEDEQCKFFKDLFHQIEDSSQGDAYDGEESLYCEDVDVTDDQDLRI